MSANVDERIVQMQFDNQQFEAKAQNTITTLNALTQALQLPINNTKSFDQVQTAANALDFSKINQAIETVNYRFSTFGIMATRVLNQVTDAAINMGRHLVESVTSEPLRAGFGEYEEKMESVKRILNSAKNEDGTAVSLEQVNRKLDELNTYADKTIYNFMDMTTNIGKFTNAGVDLDKSVLAIQGIANEAALAGANSQEASRAMYNFAQALSSGYVKLIDWKSIENANMATVGFKEELLKTAEALGTVVREGDKYKTVTTNAQGKVSDLFDATQGFNDALAHQWMTADVLCDTLARYADETTEIGKAAFKAATEVTTFSKLIDTLKEALGSGWTESWQLIIGDFEEAKQLWTGVNDALSRVISTSSDSRNTMLQYWKEWGGRTAIIEGLGNALHAIVTVLRPIKRAFNDILNPIKNVTGAAVVFTRISKGFRDLTESMILHYPIQRKIWVVAKGVFSAFDLMGQVVSAVWRTIQPIFKTLGEVFEYFAKKTVRASISFTDFVASLKETDAIYNALQKFVGILKTVGQYALDAATAVLKFFGIEVDFGENTNIISAISSLFEAFVQNPFIQGGIDRLTAIKDAIANFVTGLKDSEGFQKVTSALSKLGEALAKIGGAIKESAINALSQFGNAIKDFFTAADGTSFDFDKLFDVGIVAGLGLIFKKLYDTLKGGDSPIAILKNFFKSFKDMKKLIEDASKNFSEFLDTITGPLKELQMSIKADVLIKIATAIAILAGSILVLSMIDSAKLGVALVGLGILMAELTGTMTAMSKLLTVGDAAKFRGIGSTLVAFSAAIAILAVAVKLLSTIDPDGLLNGVVAVGILMALATLMSKLGGKNFSSKGLIGMSVAILILQIAVRKLAELDSDDLLNGVIAVGILMALMTAASKLGGKNFSGIGLIAMAGAIMMLQQVVAYFSEFDRDKLIQGVAAVSALIIAMGLFSRISGKNALTASVGTLALAYSMQMLQKVVAAFGGMDTDILGQGLMATALALAAMAVALNAMTGTLAGAAALVIAVVALKLLVPVIQALADLPFVDILKGIAGLALIFGVLIAAGTGLTPLIPTFLGFAGAIALVGAGAALLGVGLLAVSAGLAGFSVSVVAATAAAISAFGLIIAAVIEAIPVVVMLVAKGIIGILKAIGDSAEAIVQVVVQIGLALINGLRSLLPPLAEFLIEALVFIITLLNDNIPALTEAFVSMTISLIDGIALAIYNNTDRLITAVHHVLGAIIDFILATFQEILGGLPVVGGQIKEAISGIREEIAKDFNKEEGEKQGKSYGEGITSGINSEKGNAEKAAGELSEGVVTTTKGPLDSIKQEAKLAIGRYAEGIKEGQGDAEEAAGELGNSTVDSLLGGMDGLGDVGKYFNEGAANGVLDNLDLLKNAGDVSADELLNSLNGGLEVESPSKKTWETGKYVDEGLANGMADNQGLIATAVTGLGSLITGAFTSLSTAFSSGGTANGQAYSSGLTKSSGASRLSGLSLASSVVSAIASRTHLFGQNGTESGNLYASSVSNTSGTARIAGSIVGTSAVTGLGTAKTAFGAAGSASGATYASGVSSKSGDAKSAGTKIGSAAASGAKNVGGFFEAGEDSGQGYINGLLSKARDMARAAADAVRSALNAAKNAIDSHSPSRAYEKLGEDSDQGYIDGVKKRAPKVNAALDELATSAMDAFYEGIWRANAVANDDFIVTPTVSPVMDLNSVYGGVDMLTNLFNGADSVLGTITADVRNNVQDIRALVNNTNKIISTLNGRRPITIDGKTVIGWVDVELGSL